MVLLAVVGWGYYLQRSSGQGVVRVNASSSTADALNAETTPSPDLFAPEHALDQAPPVLPKTKIVVKPSRKVETHPRMGTVRFELPAGVTVLWNGRELDPDQTLLKVPVGEHSMKLVKKGSQPIESKIKVTENVPIVIRAR